MESAYFAFTNQAINAGKKKVPFNITFKHWCDLWAPHIERRGELQLQRIVKHLGYIEGNLRIGARPRKS